MPTSPSFPSANGIGGECCAQHGTVNAPGGNAAGDLIQSGPHATEQIGLIRGYFGLPQNAIAAQQDHIGVSAANVQSNDHRFPLTFEQISVERPIY